MSRFKENPLMKWDMHKFDDWGTTCSDDFKSFSRDFKKFLVSCGHHVVKHQCNHYDLSGFIEKDGKYLYYSWSWNRFSPVDLDASGVDGVLIRKAESDHDYVGKINTFCSLSQLSEHIDRLL